MKFKLLLNYLWTNYNMEKHLRNGLLAFVAATILTGIYGCHLMREDERATKAKTTIHEFQYTIVHIDPLSKCEYVAYRKDTNDMWTIVAHRGDCSNCISSKLTILSK